jgi:hypothetical protein
MTKCHYLNKYFGGDPRHAAIGLVLSFVLAEPRSRLYAFSFVLFGSTTVKIRVLGLSFIGM